MPLILIKQGWVENVNPNRQYTKNIHKHDIGNEAFKSLFAVKLVLSHL